MTPRLLLFADGGTALGIGHQARCAAIAAACRTAGLDPVLACRALPGSGDWLWEGFPVERLAAEMSAEAALAAAVLRTAPAAVVVDHYGIDAEGLRRAAGPVPLAVIDDLADRPLAVDLVLNPTPGVAPDDYPHSPVALGPAYALLRPAFPPPPPPAPRDPDLVVLGCGGTDPRGLAAAAAAVLLAEPRRRVVVLASAVGGSDAGLAALAARVGDRLRVARSLDAAGVAAVMAGAGAGVVAASTVALEATACGLPIVILRTEPNQARLAEGLRAAGGVVIGADRLPELGQLLALATVPALSLDGGGAARVAARLADLARAPRSALRPVVRDDARLLHAWANDPVVRAASFTPAPIPWDEHLAWLDRRLTDPATRMWILREDGADLAVVRLQRADEAAEVSVSVDGGRRGSGAGRRALAAAAAWAAATGFCRRIVAWIAVDNAPSLRLFAGAGYARAGDGLRGGRPAVRCERELP